jgi:hypothetical protein
VVDTGPGLLNPAQALHLGEQGRWELPGKEDLGLSRERPTLGIVLIHVGAKPWLGLFDQLAIPSSVIADDQ